MTARMNPEQVAVESHAEELFIEALQEQLPDDAVLFCNQRFTDAKGDVEASPRPSALRAKVRELLR